MRCRVQLTTDGLKAYLEAEEGAFGGDVDFAQLVKLNGEPVDSPSYVSSAGELAVKESRVS